MKICESYPPLRSEFTSFLGDDSVDRFLKNNQNRYIERLQEVDLDDYAAIGDAIKPGYVSCELDESIACALRLMLDNHVGAIMVIDDGKLSGLVTYQDFCSRVILKDLSKNESVGLLMQSDVKTVEPTLPLLEGLMLMARYGVHHLPIVDATGIVYGILSARDMPQTRRHSSLNLLQKIRETKRPEDLYFVKAELTRATSSLHQQGFAIDPITRFIAHANDAVVDKVLACALAEVGKAPCDYAFVVFGSEGREEQTLVVDQDNSIIFQPLDQDVEACRKYFLRLGEIVCDHLNELGYPHCKGGVMACRRECCMTLDEWEQRFYNWINTPDPKNVLNSQIYFDMRAILDEKHLVSHLMDKVFEYLSSESSRFIYNVANCLLATRLPALPPKFKPKKSIFKRELDALNRIELVFR